MSTPEARRVGVRIRLVTRGTRELKSEGRDIKELHVGPTPVAGAVLDQLASVVVCLVNPGKLVVKLDHGQLGDNIWCDGELRLGGRQRIFFSIHRTW